MDLPQPDDKRNHGRPWDIRRTYNGRTRTVHVWIFILQQTSTNKCAKDTYFWMSAHDGQNIPLLQTMT